MKVRVRHMSRGQAACMRRDWGLDRDTDKPPKGDSLTWGLAQLKEQDDKRAQLSSLVADAKSRVKGAN